MLNLNGSDIVEASYKDERRPGGPAAAVAANGRLLTDGKLTCTDSEYQKDLTAVHVGERLFLKVVDFDADRTPDRDKVKVRVKTKRGEEETVELVETLAHSGIFTGSVLLKPVEKPTPGNLKPDAPEIECYFGDTIEVAYTDERAASTADGKLESTAAVAVVIGTDGKLAGVQQTVHRRDAGGRDAVPHRRELLRAVQEPQGAWPARATRRPTWKPAGACCAK